MGSQLKMFGGLWKGSLRPIGEYGCGFTGKEKRKRIFAVVLDGSEERLT